MKQHAMHFPFIVALVSWLQGKDRDCPPRFIKMYQVITNNTLKVTKPKGQLGPAKSSFTACDRSNLVEISFRG
jgi:hypothetical protein